MKQIKPVNQLSVNRLFHLCRLTLFKNKRQWLTGLLAISGLLFVIWMLPLMSNGAPGESFNGPLGYPFAMFLFALWGLWITSDIFRELHSPSTAYQSLTLPATSSEKFMAAWIITYPLLLILFGASLFTISFIVSAIHGIIHGGFSLTSLFLPFSAESAELTGYYFFNNSLFLLGAILFRKNNFLKTLLAIITAVISLFFVSAVTLFIVTAGLGVDRFSFQLDDPVLLETLSNTFTFVIAFTSLLLTYLLLKKRQVVS